MKIVSYSLFGSSPRYSVNACINSDLCAQYYPNWECRIYHDSTVSSKVLSLLSKKENVRLVQTSGRGHDRRMWRFLAYDDCSTFISRDIDSYITEREVSAVSDWLTSNNSLHIMRDHPHHRNKIQAGMFGLKKNNALPEIKSLYDSFIGKCNNHLSMDEQFLKEIIYPMFLNDMVVHDDNDSQKDKTHEWKCSTNEQFVGRSQYPASIHQELFAKYERILR